MIFLSGAGTFGRRRRMCYIDREFVEPTMTPKLEDELHCFHCLYCLRGLPTNRCPECGAEFHPEVLRAISRTSAFVVPVAACLILVAVAVARLLAQGLSGDYLLEFVPVDLYQPIRKTVGWIGLALAVGLGGMVVVAAWQRLRRARRIRGRRGLPLLAGAILTAVLVAAVATIYLEMPWSVK